MSRARRERFKEVLAEHRALGASDEYLAGVVAVFRRDEIEPCELDRTLAHDIAAGYEAHGDMVTPPRSEAAGPESPNRL